MVRSLSSSSSLETLRKEAKRWLKALRAADPAALARLRAATPDAPAEPGLRDVQLALAREHGLPGWSALRRAFDERALERQSTTERIEVVLRSAWGRERSAGLRVLERWPELAQEHLVLAACTGRVDDVARLLAVDARVATRKVGALAWQPLQYLAYLRLPGDDAASVDVARLLLDHGADPDARFDDGWGNAFTVLTGLIGEGEGRSPTHPRAREIAALVIDRGADPFDSQALYNTSLASDDTSWLEFMWEQSERRERIEAWRTVQPNAIGGNVRLAAIDYLLGNAVAFGHARRAAWLLEHGARADGINAYSKRPMRDEALLNGDREMASLLERFGAPVIAPDEPTRFKMAVVRLDRDEARRLAEARPDVLQDPELMIAAGTHGLVDVLRLLLDLGTPVDLRDRGGQRALHKAAENGRVEAVKLLLARGADVDAPSDWAGGALGYAAFGKQRVVAEVLAPLSRDVNPLTFFAKSERLAALFAEDRALVNARHLRTTNTPLFSVPDDESLALPMVDFLLARGADPRYRNRDGLTAAEFVRQRGLLDVADYITDRAGADD